MLPDGFVGKEQVFGVILVRQFFFVGNQVVDAIMAVLAQHKAATVHLFLSKPVQIPFFGVNRPGYQVMLCKPFLALA